MKIEVGMYVRTKKYGIAKIVGGTFENKFNIDKFKNDGITLRCIKLKDILKASYNIRDLMKENDLVKIEYYSLRYGTRVTRLFEVDFIDKEYLVLRNAYCDFRLTNNEWSKNDKKLKPIIKEILTHEQFESMTYEVEK